MGSRYRSDPFLDPSVCPRAVASNPARAFFISQVTQVTPSHVTAPLSAFAIGVNRCPQSMRLGSPAMRSGHVVQFSVAEPSCQASSDVCHRSFDRGINWMCKRRAAKLGHEKQRGDQPKPNVVPVRSCVAAPSSLDQQVHEFTERLDQEIDACRRDFTGPTGGVGAHERSRFPRCAHQALPLSTLPCPGATAALPVGSCHGGYFCDMNDVPSCFLSFSGRLLPHRRRSSMGSRPARPRARQIVAQAPRQPRPRPKAGSACLGHQAEYRRGIGPPESSWSEFVGC
jgi:hypothetical protein